MTNRITNKKEVKLFATLAVVAFAFIALAAIPVAITGGDVAGVTIDQDEDFVFSLTINETEEYYTKDEVSQLMAAVNSSNESATVSILADVKMTQGFGIIQNNVNVTLQGNTTSLVKLTLSEPLFKGIANGAQVTLDGIEVTGTINEMSVDGIPVASAFVGVNNGNLTIDRCKVSNATITSSMFAGAFLAYNNNSTSSIVISNSEVIGSKITAGNKVGGFVGLSMGQTEISNSKISESTINDEKGDGWNGGLIAGCVNGSGLFESSDVTYEDNVINKCGFTYDFTEEYDGTDFIIGWNGSTGADTMNNDEAIPKDNESEVKPTFENNTLIVRDSQTLIIPEGVSVTAGAGAAIDNQGTIIGSLAIEADVDDLPTAYIGGDVNGAEFRETQRIEVIRDATISGIMNITGSLYVPEGYTLTIKAGGMLNIAGMYPSIIEGTLVIEEYDEDVEANGGKASLVVSNVASLEIKGNLVVAGELTVSSTKPLTISEGADVSIESTGTLAGAFDIASGASLSVEGAVVGEEVDTTISVAGTLILNSSVFSDSFKVSLENGAVLDVIKVGLKQGDAEGAKIIVADRGTEIFDKTELLYGAGSDVSGVRIEGKNVIEICGDAVKEISDADPDTSKYTYGTMVTGLKVTTTMKSSKITSADDRYGVFDGKYKHVYTMGISGTVAVEYIDEYTGDGNAPVKSSVSSDVTLIANTAATISEALFLGVGVQAEFDGYVTIDAPITLNYKSTDETRSILEFASNSEVVINSSIDASAYQGLISNETGSEITVTADGLVISKEVLADEGLNSAYYSVTVTGTATGPVTTHYYVSIDAALAQMVSSMTKEVTVYGVQSVTESVALPNGSKLTLFGEAQMNIGADADDNDVVLTVSTGATIKEKTPSKSIILVNGTLFAEKRTDINNSLRAPTDPEFGIKSAVIAYQMNGDKEVTSGWAKWTNLVVALDEATAGQRIVLNGDVTLSASTTIKEDVTLDSNGKTIVVPNSMVLTVDGTLGLVGGGILAIADYYLPTGAAANAKIAGSVVLNGYITYDEVETQIVSASLNGSVYSINSNDPFVIAGAYYSVDDVQYVSTVVNAASVIDKVQDQIISIIASHNEKAGKAVDGGTSESTTVSFSNVSFNGKALDDLATIRIYCPIVASGITLNDAAIEFETTSDSSIEVAGAAGSADIKGEFSVGMAIITAPYGDDAGAVLGITGVVSDYKVGEKEVSTEMIIDGTVYVLGSASITTDKISVSGNLYVVKVGESEGVVALGGNTKDGIKATSLVIDGTLTVCDGMTVRSVGNNNNDKVQTTVGGSIVIKDGLFEADVVTVSGTIDASSIDETSLRYTGTMTVGTLYIGVTKNIESKEKIVEETFTDSAVVNGNVKVTNYAVVMSGAVAPAGWSVEDSAASPVDCLKIEKVTTFNNVETVGADGYIKVYAVGEKKIADFQLATEDSEFKGWMNSKGKIAVSADSDDGSEVVAHVGGSDWTTVSAKVDYNIYALKITTDGGIAYISVDGVLMSSEGANVFKLGGLKAGQHTIVISAASGYDVSSVTLRNMDGSPVGSMTVSLSGKDVSPVGGYYTFEYQLIGSTVASDTPSIVIPSQPAESDDDMGLTEYLLIVLVILAAILVIVVAVRMMRS